MNEEYKYCLIVTSEDERYPKEKGLDFFMNNPWEGLLQHVLYGNNPEDFLKQEDIEGLFYQLYETVNGKRIGAGTICYDFLKENIQEWEKENGDEYL